MNKTYDTIYMGRSRHAVNFHDGSKTHRDGSPFYDMRLFRDQRKAAKFVKELRADGYTERGWA